MSSTLDGLQQNPCRILGRGFYFAEWILRHGEFVPAKALDAPSKAVPDLRMVSAGIVRSPSRRLDDILPEAPMSPEESELS